jgi:hypothetical protein
MPKPKPRIQSIRGDAFLTARIDANEFTEVTNEPDWSRTCEVCGARPVVPSTGMCGPCTFGEIETAGGNW